MAVAHDQIDEILLVMTKHVDRNTLLLILLDLRNTEAYKWNASFRLITRYM